MRSGGPGAGLNEKIPVPIGNGDFYGLFICFGPPGVEEGTRTYDYLPLYINVL